MFLRQPYCLKKKKFYQKFEKYTYQSQFNEIYISHLPKKKKKIINPIALTRQ